MCSKDFLSFGIDRQRWMLVWYTLKCRRAKCRRSVDGQARFSGTNVKASIWRRAFRYALVRVLTDVGFLLYFGRYVATDFQISFAAYSWVSLSSRNPTALYENRKFSVIIIIDLPRICPASARVGQHSFVRLLRPIAYSQRLSETCVL
jgi:hypothetical protein